MNPIISDENEQKFLIELFNRVQGDLSRQVSMFNVGEALSMDKNLSKKIAESLIGQELAQVRTLSGAMALTAQGIEEARKFGAGSESQGHTMPKSAVIGDSDRKGLEEIIAAVKNQVGNTGLNFNLLTELTADLKSIDAQMSSPRPKTAVIRECFVSIRGVLEKSNAKEMLKQIKGLLGEWRAAGYK